MLHSLNPFPISSKEDFCKKMSDKSIGMAPGGVNVNIIIFLNATLIHNYLKPFNHTGRVVNK